MSSRIEAGTATDFGFRTPTYAFSWLDVTLECGGFDYHQLFGPGCYECTIRDADAYLFLHVEVSGRADGPNTLCFYDNVKSDAKRELCEITAEEWALIYQHPSGTWLGQRMPADYFFNRPKALLQFLFPNAVITNTYDGLWRALREKYIIHEADGIYWIPFHDRPIIGYRPTITLDNIQHFIDRLDANRDTNITNGFDVRRRERGSGLWSYAPHITYFDTIHTKWKESKSHA